uniref:Uncharacterized protein n=1 Tax=Strombidinopsis acuminata TaxID=141414 RepID=A0A7S3WD19_9SPIT
MLEYNISVALIVEDSFKLALGDSLGGKDVETSAPVATVRSALHALHRSDPEWEHLNLGICEDPCYPSTASTTSVTVPNTGQSIITSTRSLCTHAYALTAQGARKLLSFSLPLKYPVDHLISLLSRKQLLRQYSVSPPTFTSSSRSPSGAYCSHPTSLLSPSHDLGNSWLVHYTPAAQACSSAYERIARTQHTGGDECSLEEFRCQIISSAIVEQVSFVDGFPMRHPHAHKLLEHMDRLKLRGALIWSLRAGDTDVRHSHAYVHRAIHDALKYTFSQSFTPRHLCWASGRALRDGCSLSKLLNYSQSEAHSSSGRNDRSVLGRSLVFASPKHMAWSHDSSLTNLPIDRRSAYIFHELMPPRFAPLMPYGRVVQWFVSGPDGNNAFLESANFVARATTFVKDCTNWPPCTRNGDREQPASFVSAWATTLTPADIVEFAKTVVVPSERRDVHFVGSVWAGNWPNFCTFVRGCHRAGVHFVRSGVNAIDSNVVTCARSEPRPFVDDARDHLDDTERFKLMSASKFTPAFQGEAHLRTDKPTLSYFADRSFDSAAIGQVVATNNPAVVAMLAPVAPNAVVFSPNVSDLCEKAFRQASSVGVQELQRMQLFMWHKHTYVSRLLAILELFQSHALKTPQHRLPDASWCAGYDEIYAVVRDLR